jgi:hypothetical protein
MYVIVIENILITNRLYAKLSSPLVVHRVLREGSSIRRPP